jgi:hypothetical protein
MSETLSLSIFTIEADSKPLLAFAAKKHREAVAFCADERVLTKLRSVRSGGVPLCNDYSILRVRLATSEERALPCSDEAAIIHGKSRSGLSGRRGRSIGPRRRPVAAPVRCRYCDVAIDDSRWPKLIVVPIDSAWMRRSLVGGSRAMASHASRARTGRSRQRQSKWAGSTRRCTGTALATAPFSLLRCVLLNLWR